MVVIQFTQTESLKVVRRSKSFNFDSIRLQNGDLIGKIRRGIIPDVEELTVGWVHALVTGEYVWTINGGSDDSHWNGWEIV